ncbi:hypothetical protein HS141_12010 [Cetobacterium somerae]|uniref:hypothetical protein n=1 Tax=Cetobacterium somerae TaxID=188913 RepID=UPI00211DE7FD|nr:hypothetical protein [Cetobacterium somerae]MCQ9627649.1 hypothetical protein [Cetobacterium somerae]
MDGGIRKEIKIDGVHDLNLPKTKIRFSKEENELIIKPLKWMHNATDEFILLYKDSDTNEIKNSYEIDIVCPEFFVAYSGLLDFEKVPKNEGDKFKTTTIHLEYNSSTIKPTYSLDVGAGNNPGDGLLENEVYLNDEKTLLVRDLKLEYDKEAQGFKRTLNLSGTLDGESIKKTPLGIYQKTLQILIHLK